MRRCEACGAERLREGTRERLCDACRSEAQRARARAAKLGTAGRDAYRKRLAERAARGAVTAGLGTAG